MKSTSLRGRTPVAGTVAALLLICACHAGDLPRYQVRDLGVLPDTDSSAAVRLNNRGEVAGVATRGMDELPFLFRGGQLIPIGLPPGPYSRGYVTDLNRYGTVVGIDRGATDFDAAFVFASDRLVGLSNVLQYQIVFRVGLNNLGAIVGTAREAEHEPVFGFVYRRGVTTRLPSLVPGGQTLADDINDAGTIIGSAQTETATPDGPLTLHAVVFARGRIIDLGTLPGGSFSAGTAINEAGDAIGYADTVRRGSLQTHAFIHRKGKMVDLGTLPGGDNSSASGINDWGQVVGFSNSRDGGFRAVLFIRGKVHDLNASLVSSMGMFLEQATDINDHGEITAIARVGAFTRAVVLTPVR